MVIGLFYELRVITKYFLRSLHLEVIYTMRILIGFSLAQPVMLFGTWFDLPGDTLVLCTLPMAVSWTGL